MNLCHEVELDKLESIRVNGIAQGSGGDKRDDDIHKTEVFLNKFRSKELTSKGLDRLNNIYCFLANDAGIIDITSGDHKQPKEIVDSNRYALVQINPHVNGCFVSGLRGIRGYVERQLHPLRLQSRSA